jgi:hypothetical protein
MSLLTCGHLEPGLAMHDITLCRVCNLFAEVVCAEPETVEEHTCVICLGPLENARVTPCMHTFCQVCLDEWKSRSHDSKCPTCRYPLRAVPPPSLAAAQVQAPRRRGRFHARRCPVRIKSGRHTGRICDKKIRRPQAHACGQHYK